MLLPLFTWLESVYNAMLQSPFGVATNLSVWLFAVVQAVHLLTLVVVGCAVLMVDLRLLGFGLRDQPIVEVAIPYSESRLVNLFRRRGRVISERYTEEGTVLRGQMPRTIERARNGYLAELERWVLLSVLDRHWREHLYEMDYLQEGIGLRAIGQRDPLVEYQREGFDMFQAMQDSIKLEAVAYVFNAPPEAALEAEARREAAARPRTELSSAVTEAEERAAPQPQRPTGKKVGRNQPCPCGSGKKYKLCHGAAAPRP